MLGHRGTATTGVIVYRGGAHEVYHVRDRHVVVANDGRVLAIEKCWDTPGNPCPGVREGK